MTPEQKAAAVVNAFAVEMFIPLLVTIPRMHNYSEALQDGSVFFLPPSKTGPRSLLGLNVYYGDGDLAPRCRPVFA